MSFRSSKKSKYHSVAGPGQLSAETLQSEIFIIDADPMVVAAIAYYLGAAGFNNTRGFGQPCNAIDALRFVRPDVIITDTQLPDVSGVFITKLIRTFGHLKEVPVIVVTSDSQPETANALHEAGANLILPKPANPDVLVPQVIETLRRSKAIPELGDREVPGDRQQAQASQELKQQESLLRRLCRPESV